VFAPVAVFEPSTDGSVVATEFARGPWDPGAQHGGAPAALLARAFEQLPSEDGLELARITYELMRPVPLGSLNVEASVVRPGRRVQLLEGSLSSPDGVELVRARALRVRRAETELVTEPEAPPPGPEAGQPTEFARADGVMFATHAMEIRFVEGAFMAPGPAIAWFRLRVPLVAGSETSALQRLAAAGDFGNGISAAVPWEDHVFINPDLTLYIDRPPGGEWICLRSETRVVAGGIGVSESVLYDSRGRVGRAVQALLVARRPTSGETP
jgi:hypothetical protein